MGTVMELWGWHLLDMYHVALGLSSLLSLSLSVLFGVLSDLAHFTQVIGAV